MQNHDNRRVPLSSLERLERQGGYPYYGATSVMDHVDDYLFSGLHLLVAEDGSVLTEAGNPVLQLVDGEFWVNNHAHVLTGEDDLDTRFIFYALSVAYAAPWITGAVQLKLNQKWLNKIEIVFPERKDREFIVGILKRYDDLIDNFHRQIECLNEAISAIFRSWFIDFDPVKTKAEGKLPYGMDDETAALFPDSFEDSKHGKFPTGWKHVHLQDLATIIKKTLNPKRSPEVEFFHYSIPAYDNGANPILTLGDDIESTKFIVPDNCVLLSKLNPKWNRVWIPELSSDYVGIASTEFLPWVPKNGVSIYYLYSLMVSQPFRWLMDSRISGTTGSHQRVRPDDCAKIPCLMPGLEVMKKFHEATEKIFQEIQNLVDTQLSLVACRDALLPKLMSGELSVPEVA